MLAKTSRQEGMASIVVVLILVTILSLLGVGFTRVLDRSITQAGGDNLSIAAEDAARAGINDTIAYLVKNGVASPALPLDSETNCNSLITGGLKDQVQLNSTNSVKYTCILVHADPSSLFFQAVPSLKSEVTEINAGSSNPTKLLISWESSTSNTTPAPTPSGGPATPPSLLDESTWNAKKYIPMLRVSLYGLDKDISDAASLNGLTSRTYYLYPEQGAANQPVGVIDFGSSGLDGTLVQVPCGLKSQIVAGNPADFECNVSITNLLTQGSHRFHYFARLTPIYGDANIKVQGDIAVDTPMGFTGGQVIVDVTARAGTAVKRLQARVDLSKLSTTKNPYNITPDEDGLPEYALRSAHTICKLIVANTNPNRAVTVPSANSDCQVY